MSDRKYSQRGYQESSRDDRSSSGPRQRREKREGPRGRGLGRPSSTVFRCAVCGEKQLASTQVEADTVCWKCGADLHTCTHCRYFDTSAPGECRQKAPYVSAKAKRNDCEQFEERLTQETAGDSGSDSPSDAKAAFDALFKI